MRGLILALCVCIIPFSASQAQTNLVTNGDFSAPLAPEWIVGNWGTGWSIYGVTNGVFSDKVTVIGTASWMVFFYHFQDIKLQGGVTYLFSFNSHATAPSYVETGTKTVGQNITPYVDVFDSIGTTDSTYSVTFTPTADDDSGQIFWDLGFGNVPLNATIYISKVAIQEYPTPVISKAHVAEAGVVSRLTRNGVTVNLVRPDKAGMKLYDLRGVEVADYSSALKTMGPGSHRINFNTRTVSNGTYLVSVNNGAQTFRAAISIVK